MRLWHYPWSHFRARLRVRRVVCRMIGHRWGRYPQGSIGFRWFPWEVRCLRCYVGRYPVRPPERYPDVEVAWPPKGSNYVVMNPGNPKPQKGDSTA